jgi:hypothetical protein
VFKGRAERAHSTRKIPLQRARMFRVAAFTNKNVDESQGQREFNEHSDDAQPFRTFWKASESKLSNSWLPKSSHVRATPLEAVNLVPCSAPPP